jgi:hypothetical protein
MEGVNAMNWIDSTQDRDAWWELVNAALNLRVQYNMEIYKSLLQKCILFQFWLRVAIIYYSSSTLPKESLRWAIVLPSNIEVL